jgi:hypothetical protein
MENNSDIENKVYFKTIIMFDFDDTIFPTSWTNKNLINLASEDSINEYKLYFLELDKTLSAFLLDSLNYGTIYIVTNANIKWIKSCLNILDLSKKVIVDNNIRIVSARDIYSQTLASPTEWKISTFRDILSETIQKLPEKQECNTFLNIISVGDAQYEYIALLNLDNYLKQNKKSVNYLLKSVKFIEKPNFDLIIDQMQIVKKNLASIVNKIGYVDLKFTN